MGERLHLPDGSAGEAGHPGHTVHVSPERAGWSYAGLWVVDLAAGESITSRTGTDEVIVLPLAGSCTVDCATGDGDERFELTGRPHVFAGPSDFCYLPRDAKLTVTSRGGGRFAIPTARADRRLPARYGPAGEVPVELRGAGACSRQVNNFAAADVFPADRLIAVEVYTPGGNWSSYPPHKHDTAGETESELEEIYYYRFTGSGVGYQRVYGSPGHPIEVLAEVRGGDVVLVPHGWHGPSMATPGYDMYYLNVMAGPGERAWRVSTDPAHAWVRDEWAGRYVDPRLPIGAADTVDTADPEES